MKPVDVDAALQAAVESHSFLEIDGFEKQTSGVNKFSTETPLDAFPQLVSNLRTKFPHALAKSSRTERNASQKGQRDSQDSDRYRSPSPGPRRNNNFSNYKNLISPTSGTPPKTANIRGITLKIASQITPKTTNETEVPVHSVAIQKNANKFGRSNHSSREQSMFHLWQIGPLKPLMPCPTPKFKLKAPAYQRRNCAGNSKSLQHT